MKILLTKVPLADPRNAIGNSLSRWRLAKDGDEVLNSHLEVFNGKSQLQKMRVFQESSDFLLGLISFEGRAVKLRGGVHLFKKRIWVLDES